MSIVNVGRPTRPETAANAAPKSVTGGRGLLQDEPLLFERDGWDKTGVDLPDAGLGADDLGDLVRAEPISLPGLSEPETLRHYVRLSQKNHAIDLALYPLGSCTMKHNPRLNEKMARLPGFADIHPLQPQSTVQGALGVMDALAHWLKTLTGMPAVALSPKAGAHGELCGLLAIRAAHEARGDARKRVLVPTSAHGTNPATAAFVGGYAVEEIAQTARWPLRRHRRPGGEARPRRGGGDDHQSQHLRPVRARHRRDRPPDPRGRGLLLLRRGQLQRHRRQGAAGRPRRRRHAHQPAQDLLHPARRRRAGRRAGGAERGAGALRAEALADPRAGRLRPGRARRRRGGRQFRPALRLPRPDGHVCPRAQLHDEPRRRRPAPGGRGRGAERQLRQGAPLGRDERAVRRVLHARGAVRRRLAGGDGRHHPRLRQGG